MKLFTEAEELIMNNWNMIVSNPEPSRAGEKRAAKRLREKQLKNKEIPVIDKPISRQVRRQAERRDFKAIRSMMKDAKRANMMEARGIST